MYIGPVIEIINFISSIISFIRERYRSQRLNKYLVGQLESCFKSHFKSKHELENRIKKILNIINEGKCNRVGRNYVRNLIRPAVTAYFNSIKCIFDVLSGNIDILEKLSYQKPEKLRAIYLMAKIYSKKGYIDIDEFIKICPKDFEEIIKQSKAFLQEELNKLQEERH